VTHMGKTAKFGGKPGELTAKLGRELKGIQYGTVADTRGWMAQV
jgi:branched-chain amino acid aminotransferase